MFAEPTGRTAPRIAGDGLNKNIGHSASPLVMLCDAQAFPAPNMRYLHQPFHCTPVLYRLTPLFYRIGTFLEINMYMNTHNTGSMGYSGIILCA